MVTHIITYTYLNKSSGLMLCDNNHYNLICDYWFWNFHNPVSVKDHVHEKPGPDYQSVRLKTILKSGSMKNPQAN